MSIIIIGAGIIGSILAINISKLSNGTIPIDIIETNDPEHKKYKNENRTIALSAGTYNELSKIKIWKLLKNLSTPIKNICVNEKNNFGSLLFNSKDYEIPALGYSIELKKFNEKIFNLLKTSNGVNLHCPNSVVKIISNKKKITVVLNTGIVLHGKLLVIASGCNNHNFLEFSSIKFRIKNYNQFAVISNIRTQKPHNNYAFEIFTENGVIAFLPIKNNKFSIIWCLPIEQKKQVNNWSDEEFLYYLQLIFGWKLGKFISIEKRYIYPLLLKIPNKVVCNRIVLIGNTAQTLHPIAGQGLNIGIRDAICLSSILIKYFFLREDIGKLTVLKHYSNIRKYDRQITIFITDKLIDIFNNKNLSIILCRNFGLNIVNNLSVIKNIFSKKMLGFF